MMPAMYSAIGGLETYEDWLNVTANNLSNSDTVAYKAESASFEAELSELLEGSSGESNSNGGTDAEQEGLGVTLGAVENDMSEGSLESTDNAEDVAIDGDGFLVVATGGTVDDGTYTGGDDAYTRDGELTTDADGYLTTESGAYVLGYSAAGDEDAAPDTLIQIPSGATDVAIGTDGAVTYELDGDTETAGYVALASFENEAGLERSADNTWVTSLNSGTVAYGTAETGTFEDSVMEDGELEESNVNMATEFANMISAERGYQANSSVMSTVSDMMQSLIQVVQ